jgi:hypothetical protein
MRDPVIGRSGGARIFTTMKSTFVSATENDTTVGNRRRQFAWLLSAGLAGFMGFTLPACSTGGMPITISGITDYGAVAYSAKGGLVLTVDRRSAK